MTKKFNAKAHIVALNTLRIQLALPFTSKIIRQGLKECNLPSNALFWTIFLNSGLVTRIAKDLFVFTNPKEPIHFSKLDAIYRDYNNRMLTYHNRWYYKKKQQNILNREDIQAAIKLLKENGMMILVNSKNIYHSI